MVTGTHAAEALALDNATRAAALADGAALPKSGPWFLLRANLQVLIDELRADGRKVIGPTVADGAIVYDEITTVADLPEGWGDVQDAGQYRLNRRRDRKLFNFNMGPASWKRFTFPPVVPLNVGRREGREVTFEPAAIDPPRLAFLGVRGCELAALGIQDRVFLGGPYTDEDYRARRAAAFVVAVNCTTAAPTCFCTSMGTGPEIRGGHDLVLTELDEGFVVRAGSAGRGGPARQAAGQGRRRGPDLPGGRARSARSPPRSATRSRRPACTIGCWPSSTARSGPRSPNAA